MKCDTLVSVREKCAEKTVVTNRSGCAYKFELINGLLYKVCTNSHNAIYLGKKQLVVPFECRKTILRLAHDAPTAGHFSHRKTQMKVFEQFFWPGASSDITRYCRSCDICQKVSYKGKVKPVPLQSMPVMTIPFQRIAIDLIGPFSPPSEEGHKYVLTIIDYATRYPEAIPLKNIDTISVAEALISVFARVGIPKEILSDRGRQFTSDLMAEIDRLLNIKPLFTTPWHPAANGLVEKMNGTIKSIIKKLCQDRPRQWHRFIPAALFAIREIPNDSLKYSPFELLYGRKVRGPLTILAELWENKDLDEKTRTTYQYVFDIRNRLEETAKLAANNLNLNATKYKNYFDKKSQKRKFKVGDEVLVLLSTDNKLLSQWKGPYKIIECRNNVDYVVDMNPGYKLFHANILKLYYRRDSPGNLHVPNDYNSVDKACRLALVNSCLVVDEDNDLGDLCTIDYEKNIANVNDNLSTKQRAELFKLLENYKTVISSEPGCTDALVHEIKLTTNEPIRKKPYSVPLHLREDFDAEIDTMFKLGIIEHSNSPYCHPAVMVRKKNLTWRVVIDFRLLNEITQFDAEPVPKLDEDLHKFVDAKYITELDICKAYFQIPLAEESRKYTAFPTSRGLMQFTRLPFGLCTSGASYVRLMRKVFQGARNISWYFDNIYVFSKSWFDHVDHLKDALNRLQNFGLTAGPSKCFFAYENIKYLGFNLGSNCIAPLTDRVEAIKALPLPDTKSKLRSFIGTVAFYNKFIHNFAGIAAPITEMLKKGSSEKLNWNKIQMDSFVKLQNALVQAPVLRLPDVTKTFCLRTDASSIAVGAVLLQYINEYPMPVAYASKKLLPREKNFSTIERECLAIIWGVLKFRTYLFGKEFLIETDHEPLAYLKKAKLEHSRLMRWALALQPFNFRVVYIKGKENCCADMLSRC